MKNKIHLFYKLILFILILGGIFGIIKGTVPSLSSLDYFHLITGRFEYGVIVTKPLYERIYGLLMAALEISCIYSLIQNTKKSMRFAFIVVSINLVGCVISLILGNLFSIISILTRIAALFVINLEYKITKIWKCIFNHIIYIPGACPPKMIYRYMLLLFYSI